MKSRQQLRRKFAVTSLIVILLTTSALLGGCIEEDKSKDESLQDTEGLAIPFYQTENDMDQPEKHFSLKDKQTIEDGKYGFVKQVVFDKKAGIWLSFSGDSEQQCKDVRLGLYKDKELKKPVEETAFTGIDYENATKESEDGAIVVDAGTYYVGLYTKNKEDTFSIEYESWYGEIHTDLNLKPGKPLQFFVENAKQDTYFKIQPQKTGQIEVEASILGGAIQLHDANKKPISKKINIDGASDTTYKYNVKKSKDYYIKISDVDLDGAMSPNSISYVIH